MYSPVNQSTHHLIFASQAFVEISICSGNSIELIHFTIDIDTGASYNQNKEKEVDPMAGLATLETPGSANVLEGIVKAGATGSPITDLVTMQRGWP